jgi:Cu-Zn family superoxide dismutase
MTGLGKLAGVAAVALAGVAVMAAAPAHRAGARHAVAVLHDAAGAEVGTATVEETSYGISLVARVHGLPAGKHGIHLHAVGKCEAPDFASAGGHWNPDGKQHGLMNPMGYHAGDMMNMTVSAEGKGGTDFQENEVKYDQLIDADGAALVVHAAEDDLKTDPSGNSGARIACGVFVAA